MSAGPARPGSVHARRAAAWLETERPNLHAAVGYAAGPGGTCTPCRSPPRCSGFLMPTVTGTSPPPSTRPPSPRPARPGTGPARPTPSTKLGSVHRTDRGLPGRRRQPGPGAGALPGPRRPARPGRRPQQPGPGATADRGLPAAAASHEQALALARGLGHRRAEACTLNCLGLVQQLTGDYLAAAASLARGAGAVPRASATGAARPSPCTTSASCSRLTGDYPAAAASHQQALKLFRDLGDRPGQAFVLNDLGVRAAG